MIRLCVWNIQVSVYIVLVQKWLKNHVTKDLQMLFSEMVLLSQTWMNTHFHIRILFVQNEWRENCWTTLSNSVLMVGRHLIIKVKILLCMNCKNEFLIHNGSSIIPGNVLLQISALFLRFYIHVHILIL